MACQKTLGLDPVVITSPFQGVLGRANGNPEYIKDIPYYRTKFLGLEGTTEVRSTSIWRSALRFPALFLFGKQVSDVAKRIQPSIVHAHSPFYCGLIGSMVAKNLNIPCLYEVRGIWESSSVFAENSKASIPQKVMRVLENRAMKRADAIIVISEYLKKELSSRGIANKTYIVPNGVDTRRFMFKEKSKRLVEELHLEDRIVLGYIGTLSAEYEGLENLIKALPIIIKKHPRVVLLLVGDGRLKELLDGLSRKLGVSGNVFFAGSIAHDRVPEYYSIIDIAVFPRKWTRETEYVTALKPIEAMAGGIPVIGSNVGGMQELISDGKTGILFKADDVKDLADKCIDLIEQVDKRDMLGKQGKKWTTENRDWMKIVSQYEEIYKTLLVSSQNC